MKARLSPFCVLLFIFPAVPSARAQRELSDPAARQRAVSLFDQGKRLEALPLLEQLAQERSADSEILVDLAASLVDHAATLTDADAAARERFRARDILQKAWAMGNPSPLAENLRQLLAELPSNGSLKFSDNPEVQRIMLEAEAAFSRREFDVALRDYAKALELDPASYPATLFTANTYDHENAFPQAAEWYERTIKLDPNIETAYRYYADMLAKQGDMTKARTMLINAAVAEPYNKIVWREIRAWAIINNTAFNLVYVPIPQQSKDNQTRSAERSDKISAAWSAYQAVRTAWQKGGRFRKEFPSEPEYRHSLREESEALNAAATILEQLKQDKLTSQQVSADPAAGLLLKLYEAGLIDPYVLFSLGDDGIAMDYVAYRAKNRAKLAAYMDSLVMPPVRHESK